MSKKEKIYKNIEGFISDFLFFGATVLFLSLRWARRCYPMQLPWNVFFVLSANTAGHDSGTFLSALKGFLIPSFIIFVFYRLAIFVISKKTSWFTVKKRLLATSLYMVSSIVMIIILIKAWSYIGILHEVTKKPTYSEFYEENFIPPENVSITSPENKRNLVVIFMESMESSYFSLEEGGVFETTPVENLQKLAKENVCFSGTDVLGGGINLEGTSWTAAGILAKLSALPYFNPFSKIDGKTVCLPEAIMLTDILSSFGYKEVFLMGSLKQFEDRDAILESHGVEIHDIEYYRENGLLPEEYQIFWGFEDSKLYDFAKTELETLGEGDSPFFFGMLTVDTHYPKGFKCPDCRDIFDFPMMNTLDCADRRVGAFIDWMKSKPWFSNTTVVILGDHCYLDAPKNNFISDASNMKGVELKERRRFLDIIINPVLTISEERQRNRLFSSFDIFPTVLECMGFSIENGGIALGRSLLGNQETLVEKYGEDTVNAEIMKNTLQYSRLKGL